MSLVWSHFGEVPLSTWYNEILSQAVWEKTKEVIVQIWKDPHHLLALRASTQGRLGMPILPKGIWAQQNWSMN